MKLDKMPEHLISDELLAQYIDGTLPPEDTSHLLSLMADNLSLQEEYLLATKATAFVNDNFGEGNNHFTVFNNPAFPFVGTTAAGFLFGGVSAHNLSSIENNSNSNDRFEYSVASNHTDNNHLNTEDMGSSSSGIIGMPNPIQQSYADTCAIKSQQLILQDFGIDVSEDQLVEWSHANGLYSGNGTSMEDVGVLLQQGGVPVESTQNASVFDLVGELSQGHKVIVGVDSGELWNSGVKEWWEDVSSGGHGADHALIVAGIDNTDPNSPMVLLTDPGSGELCKSYPLDQFMDAWKDSNCFMVSTQISPAEFADVQVANNQPAMHLADIGGNSYSDFQLFHDVAQSLPDMGSWDYLSGGVHPVNSLTEAYLNYAQTDNLQQIFDSSQYDFMHHVDTNSFVANYSDTYMQMMQDPMLANSGIENFVDGNQSADYLNSHFQEQASYFDHMGNEQMSDFFGQQAHFTEFCQAFGVNPTDVYSHPDMGYIDMDYNI